MVRVLALFYGVFAYIVFLGSFLFAIGFLGAFVVPKTIDSAPANSTFKAILVDVALLSLFAVQHSVMARPVFKQWWTRVIPAAIERSTYVLASSLVLGLIFWHWQSLPDAVWHFTHPFLAAVIWIMFGLGWLIVLASTFQINHFDLFGLRQVVLYATGRPYTSIPFRTPWMYRVVRHPIMLGFLIAFWSTPRMSQGHLLFAAVVTGYVLVALQLEERDLLAYHGETYSTYQRQVRMLVPIPGSRNQPPADNSQ